jgi:DNA-binding MarR family transcriptional regulator
MAAGTDEFLDAFDAFAQAVRRARGAVAQRDPTRLTFSQYALLTPLADGSAARVSDLATEASISPSTATRILDGLERRRVVSRRRAPDDRRGVSVSLTADGRDLLLSQDQWIRGRQRAFHEGLPAHEQELASNLLVRLAALIDEIAAGPAE